VYFSEKKNTGKTKVFLAFFLLLLSSSLSAPSLFLLSAFTLFLLSKMVRFELQKSYRRRYIANNMNFKKTKWYFVFNFKKLKVKSAEISCVYFTKLLGILLHYLKKFLRVLKKVWRIERQTKLFLLQGAYIKSR